MAKWLPDELKTIAFEVRDRVAWITLNRPEKRNAINVAMMQEVSAALREADDLKSVHCVVLQGAGKDFCGGNDLNPGGYLGAAPDSFDAAAYRAGGNFEDDAWGIWTRGQPRLQPFDMHKPIVAKVHGNCLAGGTDFALMCDIVIAATDARIGYPATRAIGSPPNHMWLYHCGPQWAKRLLFTGDAIRGRDAAKIGLVLKAVRPEKLDAEVAQLAHRIAAVSPDLLAAHKRIVNLGMEMLGARTLQRVAAENDARAHLSSAFSGFFDEMQAHGLKEALRRRDAPFGTGEASTDEEV
jgi:enoyl-CoA hydratase